MYAVEFKRKADMSFEVILHIFCTFISSASVNEIATFHLDEMHSHSHLSYANHFHFQSTSNPTQLHI
jgi:hypothetical protein